MEYKHNGKVKLFIDEDIHPIAELDTPVQFDLNTTKLTDGEHTLKIVGKTLAGREGVRTVKFIVRNGPAIDIDGISQNQVVDGTIPLMINSYDKGNLQSFNIHGSETPKSVPTWMWIVLISFVGWAAYYFFTYIDIPSFLIPK